MTTKITTPHAKALTTAGLSPEQAYLYELLLQHGPRQAGGLTRFMDVSRPYIYKILGELIEMGLVTKDEPPGKAARFSAAHPFAVQELVRKQKEEIEIANETVQGVMGSLISEYTRSSHLPGIRIIPGDEGLATLYADILHEKDSILLIRSTRDDDTPERLALVLEQIKKQVERGVHTRLIGPLPADISIEELTARDASRLTERRVFSREKFSLPAQVIIYKNKVGMTSYSEPLITTIIENPAIATTMRTLFEITWNAAQTPEEFSKKNS